MLRNPVDRAFAAYTESPESVHLEGYQAPSFGDVVDFTINAHRSCSGKDKWMHSIARSRFFDGIRQQDHSSSGPDKATSLPPHCAVPPIIYEGLYDIASAPWLKNLAAPQGTGHAHSRLHLVWTSEFHEEEGETMGKVREFLSLGDFEFGIASLKNSNNIISQTPIARR